MDIVADAGTGLRSHQRGRPREVVGSRDLEVGRFAWHQLPLYSQRIEQGHFVGTTSGSGKVRPSQKVDAPALRCLHGEETVSVDEGETVAVPATYRVWDWHPRGGRAHAADRLE